MCCVCVCVCVGGGGRGEERGGEMKSGLDNEMDRLVFLWMQ